MRRFWLTLAVLAPGLLCVFLLFSDRLRSPPDVRVVVDRALQAHGGGERIALSRRGRVKGKMVVELGPPPAPTMHAEWNETFDLPERLKRDIRMRMMGEERNMRYALREGLWYMEKPDGGIEVTENKGFGAENHLTGTLTVLDALRNETDTLEMILPSDTKYPGTIGLRSKGTHSLPEIYFDKKTGLLTHVRKSVELPPMMGGSGIMETVNSEFKDIDGMKMPMHIEVFKEGRRMMDITLTEVKFLDHVDDSEFELEGEKKP